MKITVHRGSDEIGGACVELESGKTRVIIDFGTPLTKTGGGEIEEDVLKNPSIDNKMLPDIPGLYGGSRKVDAVLLSHAHLDHYGLMNHIDKNIPIYMSRDAKAIIEVGNIFWKDSMKQPSLLENAELFQYWKPFRIGDFTITPYLVDHSAFGSSAFLVESEGKRVFHTGDFRAHGNKSITYEKLLTDPKLKNLDALIIEGTTLGSGHAGMSATEKDVLNSLTETFKKQKDASFVISSGSNLDRLVSIYKATKAAKKELVLDLYQYFLLMKLKEANPNSQMPPFDGDHIRIFYPSRQAQKLVDNEGKGILYKYKKRKINRNEIVERRGNIVLRLSIYEMTRLARIMKDDTPLNDANFIYSMWSGYLKAKDSFQKFSDELGMPILEIHSSGHAYEKDLMRLVRALDPKKLVPIHTLNRDAYKKEFHDIVVNSNEKILT